MEAIIPLWVEGRLVWITGLTKRTTCRDVIDSVISFQWGKNVGTHERWNYRVIERWRWMERHLPSRCKILRVWQSWCEERKNVYFLLKKRSPKSESPSKERKYTRIKMPRSRHGHKSHRKMKLKNEQYVMDRDELKSILSMQQNALMIQKEKLALRETEIEEYETVTHLDRIKQNGENYLQNMYLGSEDAMYHGKSNIRSDRPASLSDETVYEATLLYERILEISRRIEKQEDNIRQLSAQIRHSISISEVSERSETFDGCFGWQNNDESFEPFMRKTKIRTDCLAALNESQNLAIEHNERTLQEYDKILSKKQNYLTRLENDLYVADSELNYIQQDCSLYNANFYQWDSSVIISPEDFHVIDNSSDTGLSSLPSSCDDSGYLYGDKSCILDTLV